MQPGRQDKYAIRCYSLCVGSCVESLSVCIVGVTDPVQSVSELRYPVRQFSGYCAIEKMA